ncbi:hypothetical protein C5167_019709 [Papaver somniferum]|uniref:Uncharacterized protein n=1 Tax=Papaver somniferum TaxID=3469 RepID=A0A4Y7IQW5_PAPSO|nr:hypothetical protein C5167_019709 [Papaver somniferum]
MWLLVLVTEKEVVYVLIWAASQDIST